MYVYNKEKISRANTIPNNLKLCSLRTLTFLNKIDFFNPFLQTLFKRRFVEGCFIKVHTWLGKTNCKYGAKPQFFLMYKFITTILLSI